MSRWNVTFAPGLNLDTSQKLLNLVIEAESYRRSVLKIPVPPHVARRLDKLNIVRQIRGTTGIEGNSLDEAAIERVLDTERRGESAFPPRLEELEVLNAERALEFIREVVARAPAATVTEKLVRDLHRINTEGCRYPNNVPGAFRQHNVEVGEYRPPDHEAIPGLLTQFVDFINSRRVVEGYGPLIRAVLAHFYLISIHPFGDGNGRTSRALEAFLLFQGGYNVRGFYSLANFYYKRRSEYIKTLQEARFAHQGDPSVFVLFSLKGFAEELEAIQDEILDYVKRVIFRDVYFRAAQEGHVNSRGLSLLEYLTFDAPQGIPVDAFRNRLHHIPAGLYADIKSPRTLLRDLQAWQKLGLVVERGGMLLANLDLLTQQSHSPGREGHPRARAK